MTESWRIIKGPATSTRSFATWKVLVIILFTAFSLTCTGQTRISDNLLYDLALKSVADYTSMDVKVFRSVTIPNEFWDVERGTPRKGSFFTEADFETISKQIKNPAIDSWDIDAFRNLEGVQLVNKPRSNNCLIISLPIVSSDQRTIVVSFQTMDKRSGSGYATVWKKGRNNSWVKKEDRMLWVTMNEPMHEPEAVFARGRASSN